MSKIRLVLVSVSTVALVLCLGLFSARATNWMAPSAQTAPSADTAPATPATGDDSCNAGGETDEDAPLVVPAASCPSGTVFTKCPCGGEGCRPRNMSPANFCAC